MSSYITLSITYRTTRLLIPDSGATVNFHSLCKLELLFCDDEDVFQPRADSTSFENCLSGHFDQEVEFVEF